VASLIEQENALKNKFFNIASHGPSAKQAKNLAQPVLSEVELTKKGEALHGAIHELRKQSPLTLSRVPSNFMLPCLAKRLVRKPGWFLDALEKKFVIERFKSVQSFQNSQSRNSRSVTPTSLLTRSAREIPRH